MTRNNRQQSPAVFNGREYSHHQLWQLIDDLTRAGREVEIISCDSKRGWTVKIRKYNNDGCITNYWQASTPRLGRTPMAAMRIALERMEAARRIAESKPRGRRSSSRI
ncbi:MAG: hypothetical protein ABFD89_19340 [Bryobacteraceae bacterium]